MIRSFVTIAFALMVEMPSASGYVMKVELESKLQEVYVPVRANSLTGVYLPVTIDHISEANKRDYTTVWNESRPYALDLHTHSHPSPANMNIEAGKYRVSLRLVPVTSDSFADRVEFIDPEQQFGPESSDTDRTLDVTSAWLSTVQSVEQPRRANWEQDGHGLLAETGFIQRAGNRAVLPITVRNIGDYTYPVGTLQLVNHRDQPVDLQYVYGEPSSTLKQGGELTVVFHLTHGEQIAKGWALKLLPPSSAVMSIVPAKFVFPEDRPRGPLEDRLLVAAHGLYGASKIDDGVGNELFSWTSSEGVGAQFLFGVSKRFSVQAIVDVMRSGAVTFQDATWGQVQGELRTTETAGRILAGGVLHAPTKRWLPFGRFAVGVRLANHSRVMNARDESEVRAGLAASFGGGLNILISKWLVGGASVAYTASFAGDDSTQTFEAGVHLGTTWDFGPR